MARLREPSLFLIVPIKDARKLTGLEADELEAASQVQRLTRVSADGKREPALRVPRALLLEAQAEAEAAARATPA